jgi:hypothetical protein
MGRRFGAAALASGLVLAGAVAASADLVLPSPKPPGPDTRIAIDALNGAMRAVTKGDRACRLRFSTHRGSITHAPIPQDMLDAFAIFRRPATPADRPSRELLFPFANRIAVDYARRARVLPDGTAIYVIPALDARPHFTKRPADCRVRERAALEHRLRGKPAAVQRLARRILRAQQREEGELAQRPAQPGLFVFARGPHGGGGGGGDVAMVREHGSFGSSHVRGRGSLVVGLVPDGVAKIEFAFARGRSLEPEHKTRRTYRTVYRRTVAVVHNIAALTVPRLPLDALFYRQVWRAADGSVVNVVRAPGLREG